MTGPGGRNLRKSWHPGGTDARAELGWTCPPEQLGPTFEARADCPTHGLHTLELPDPSDWVTIRTDDGLEARAATAEAAGRMIDRMRARRAD
jgi:hypothetical protein